MDNRFIRWFHEFSVTTNLLIFCETEFVHLFLCTDNDNNNIFAEKCVDSYLQNWYNYRMNSLVISI